MKTINARAWPALETKNSPDAVAELKAAFDGYHGEIKSVVAQLGEVKTILDTERKEREDLEKRMNRLGIRTAASGEIDVEEVKAVGEAFRSYIKSGDKGALLQLKGMSTLSDPEGGYVVYPSLSTSMTKKVFESSPLRRYARVVSVGTGSFEEILDLNEPDASWVGEKTSRTDTDAPDIGKFIVPVREVYAQPKVTQTLLDDAAFDIGAWLIEKCAASFTRKETTAFFSGNGTSQPRGFLTYSTTAEADSARAWGVLQHVATGVDGDFAASAKADKLIDVQSELKTEYRANAVWLMNRRTAGSVSKFKDSQNQYIWQKSMTMGQPDMLLGHPVVLCEDMPDVASGTLPIAFGDFNAGYTIVDRHGERVLQDPYTDKPNTRFYMYRRVGGDVANFEAIKFLKMATS